MTLNNEEIRNFIAHLVSYSVRVRKRFYKRANFIISLIQSKSLMPKHILQRRIKQKATIIKSDKVFNLPYNNFCVKMIFRKLIISNLVRKNIDISKCIVNFLIKTIHWIQSKIMLIVVSKWKMITQSIFRHLFQHFLTKYIKKWKISRQTQL